MTMDHLVIAFDGTDGRFVTLTRRNGDWQPAYDVGKRGGVLSSFIDKATATLLENWGMTLPLTQTHPRLPIPHSFAKLPSLTVTTRTIAEIAEQGLVEDEADFATALPN